MITTLRRKTGKMNFFSLFFWIFFLFFFRSVIFSFLFFLFFLIDLDWDKKRGRERKKKLNSSRCAGVLCGARTPARCVEQWVSNFLVSSKVLCCEQSLSLFFFSLHVRYSARSESNWLKHRRDSQRRRAGGEPEYKKVFSYLFLLPLTQTLSLFLSLSPPPLDFYHPPVQCSVLEIGWGAAVVCGSVGKEAERASPFQSGRNGRNGSAHQVFFSLLASLRVCCARQFNCAPFSHTTGLAVEVTTRRTT